MIRKEYVIYMKLKRRIELKWENYIIVLIRLLPAFLKEMVSNEKIHIGMQTIFQVPADSDLINKNLRLNNKFQVRQDLFIKQAYKFHTEGKLKEAEKYYQKILDKGSNDYRIFSNYGSLLKDLDKLSEAEISTRKAIELKPDFANSHYILGTILREIGKLKEAEKSYRKAIKLKPNFAESYCNLSNVLRDLGKLEEAEIYQKKAIKIRPNLVTSLCNLGTILKDLGKFDESLYYYLKVIKINSNFPNIYSCIVDLLSSGDPSSFNKSNLKYILNIVLEMNTIRHNKLFRVFNYFYSDSINSNLKKVNFDISNKQSFINDKIFINGMKKIIFKDIKLEIMLTKIRKDFCLHIANEKTKINDTELEFIIALGEQCFINEYIYKTTEEENTSINKIINRCKNGEINEVSISILSCYFKLYNLCDSIPLIRLFNSLNFSFNQLIKLQILEPLDEINLSNSIKKIGSISDEISKKVKAQYEKNPYPRYRDADHLGKRKISIHQAINVEITPNYLDHKVSDYPLNILVAGCGTGQHILNTQRYRNAKIIGIDLSLSSLSYAQRKINELRIDNVELIQMDLLEVDLLGKKFDIIESSGVLHHMNDPNKGLKALLGVLKYNGFLKLGLYSELARQPVLKAINYIKGNNINSNEDDIRNFRQKVISGELGDLSSLQKIGDFYSLSLCRDLCFHTKEHRYTMNQLIEILKSNKLIFHGFMLPKYYKSLYKKEFPEDMKQINLHNWLEFEKKHSSTFNQMYQFWVSKH